MNLKLLFTINLFIQLILSTKLNQLSETNSTINCELNYQFYETQPKFDLNDCVDLIRNNIDNMLELNIFYSEQIIPLEFKEKKVEIQNIEAFNDILFYCAKLESLSLIFDNPYYSLGYEDLYSFTDPLQQLTNLKYLNLNFANQNLDLLQDGEQLLQKYFDTDNLKNLQELHLNFYSNNVMLNFKEVFKNLTGLQVLSLNLGGLINKKKLEFLDKINLDGESFESQKKLKSFKLQINNVTIDSYNLLNIFTAVNNIPTLELIELNISDNTFYVMQPFEEKLDLPNLKSFYFDLSQIEFLQRSYELNESFQEVFKHLNSLIDLKINIDSINHDVLLSIFSEELQQQKNLKYFQSLEIYCAGASKGLTDLYESIRQMKLLQYLKINGINNMDAENLNQMIDNKLNLRTLIIGNIYSINKQDLKNALQKIPYVENIEIGFRLTEDEVNIFEQNTKIISMKLNIVNDCDQVQQNLGDLFKNQTQLKNLELNWEMTAKTTVYTFDQLKPSDNIYKSFQILLRNQKQLEKLDLSFYVSYKQMGSQNFDFIGKMVNNLTNIKEISIDISCRLFLQIELNFLNEAFQNMQKLEKVSMQFYSTNKKEQNYYMNIKSIDQFKNAFDNCQKIQEIYLLFNNPTGLTDYSPLKSTFKKLINLKSLNLNIILDYSKNGTKNPNLEFLDGAFENNSKLENLIVDVQQNKKIQDYSILQNAFKNNNKLKKLWLKLYIKNNDNFSYNKNVLNSVLYPLYDTITDFQMFSPDSDYFLGYIDLNYLKSRNQRLIFSDLDKKFLIKDCGDNFDSPCLNCVQKKGECGSCLFNFIGENCSDCEFNYFLDTKIQQCQSCNLINEKCFSCNENNCLQCVEGYEIDKKNKKKCIKIQEKSGDDDDDDKSNTGLIIGLSIGGGFLVLIIIVITIFILRKRKILTQQNDEISSLID